MEKKHIITIAGDLGSGKSTAAKNVAKELNYTHASTGDFLRSLAEGRGMSLTELNTLAETDPSIDNAVDNYSTSLGQQQDNIVLDSRLGFHFIPQSFKVFLEIDPAIAAERILKDKEVNPNRRKEDNRSFDSVEEIASSITDRLNSEQKRYAELYNISNNRDHSNYDLVINTGLAENTIERVPEIIIAEYNNWLSNEKSI